MGSVSGGEESGHWALPGPLSTVIQQPITKNPEVGDETMPHGQATSSPRCFELVSVLRDTSVGRSTVIAKVSRSFEPGESAHLPSWDAGETGCSEEGRRSPRQMGNDHGA
jgi:hypothetical protein